MENFFFFVVQMICFRVTLGVLGVRLVETIWFTTFKETVCSGEVRRNDSQTTKKAWQPLKDHSPPKNFPNDFFPPMSRRRETTHRKDIRRWRSSWREAWTPADDLFEFGSFLFLWFVWVQTGWNWDTPQKFNIDENGHIKKNTVS